jgi:hypothetical protein
MNILLISLMASSLSTYVQKRQNTKEGGEDALMSEWLKQRTGGGAQTKNLT